MIKSFARFLRHSTALPTLAAQAVTSAGAPGIFRDAWETYNAKA